MTHNITNIKGKLSISQKVSPRPWKGEHIIEDADGDLTLDVMGGFDGLAIVATMNAADDMVELVETMLQWKRLIGVFTENYSNSPEEAAKINQLTGRMHAILERFSL